MLIKIKSLEECLAINGTLCGISFTHFKEQLENKIHNTDPTYESKNYFTIHSWRVYKEFTEEIPFMGIFNKQGKLNEY